MFSYSSFHTNFFSRQPCTNFEVSSNSESLKFTEILEFFFISYPELGQKEGKEHERIMFYYPETEMVDKKTDVTGFAEAVVNFTGSFINSFDNLPSTSQYNYRYVNSANTCEIILSVEEGKFLIGTCLNRMLCKSNDYVPHLATIRTVIIKVYESFRLFHGSLTNLFSNGINEFKKSLKNFFTPYLSLLNLNKIPLVDLFSGVDFMPLSSVEYLEVECLVTRCLAEFPEITHSLFFYQDKLIQHSVEKSDLIVINQFLTKSLIPFTLHSGLQPEVAAKPNRDEKHTGSFILGLDDFWGILSPSSFPIIYVSSDCTPLNSTNYQPYELVAYHALNATICLLVPFNVNTERSSFLENLSDFLDSRMCALASRIGDAIIAIPKSMQTDPVFNFIYYNPDSLSMRTSFLPLISCANVLNTATVPLIIHKLIYETYDHFASEKGDFAQVYVKAENDWWIVFKKVNRRILLLFIPLTPPSTITDVYACTDSIVKSHFNHIFVS